MSLYSWSVQGNRWMPVKPGNVWAWSVQGNRWMRIVSMKSWSVSGNRWLEIFPNPTVQDLYDRSDWEHVRGRRGGTGSVMSGSGGVIWGSATIKKSYGINNMVRRLTGIKIQARITGRSTPQTLKFQIGLPEGIQGEFNTASWHLGWVDGWIDLNTDSSIFDIYVTNNGGDSGDNISVGDIRPVEFRFAD